MELEAFGWLKVLLGVTAQEGLPYAGSFLQIRFHKSNSVVSKMKTFWRNFGKEIYRLPAKSCIFSCRREEKLIKALMYWCKNTWPNSVVNPFFPKMYLWIWTGMVTLPNSLNLVLMLFGCWAFLASCYWNVYFRENIASQTKWFGGMRS